MAAETTVPDASAGSSPAPSTPMSAEAVVESMSTTEKRSWELTGDMPDRVRVTPLTPKTDDLPAASSAAQTDADSSPAEPAAQVASTDASPQPDSEPGTPPKKKSGHRGNADTRVQELLESDRRNREEIARLQGRLEALSPPRGRTTPDAAPGSSPETRPATQTEYKRYLAMPDAPKLDDFTGENGLAEWTAAMGVFIADQRWADHQGRAQSDARFRSEIDSVTQVGIAAKARIETYSAQHPDFAETVHPGLLALPTATVRRLQGQPVGPQHVLAEEVSKSPVVSQLLAHFSTPAGHAEWADLCTKPYGELMRGFERVERRFDAGSGAPAPTTKHVSGAPEPQTVLGNRASDTSDPVEAAIRRKDVGAYIREANKRELAALRG